MSTEYEKVITNLKDNLEKAKNMKFKAEARLEQLNKQKDEIIAEIRAMKLEPENLDKEIESIRTQIDSIIIETNKLLPE